MADDLSKKTVFALVILTIIVSFIGAWVSITAAGSAPPAQPADSPESSAQVSFTVEEPARGAVTGMVALVIEPQE